MFATNTLMENNPLPQLRQPQQSCSSSGGSAALPDLSLIPGAPLSTAPSANSKANPQVASNCSTKSPAVKRFHQTYGTAVSKVATLSTTNVVAAATKIGPETQIRPSATIRNYTESWVHSYHNHASLCSDITHSNAALSHTPSLFSSSSLASNISAFSGLSIQTELSVLTDMDTNEMPCFPAMMANDNYYNNYTSSKASTSSFMENVNPNFFQIVDDHLCFLIDKFESSDEQNLLKALNLLNEFAKARKFVYCESTDRIVQILHHLFYILTLQNRSQKVKNVIISTLHEMTSNRLCMDAFYIFIETTKGAPIPAICGFLNPNEKCGRFAITVLHTLFYNKRTGKLSRYFAQRIDVMINVMEMINSFNCTYKQIPLDALRFILHNSRLKMLFKQHNGIEMCLRLMKTEPEEKVLYRIVLLMVHLLNSADLGEHFVQSGGAQIIANYLEHPSPKLILNIAKCLAMISDSPKLSLQKLDNALQRVIQILGSRDMDLVFHATGFLANAQNNNLKAKIFLHDNDAINNLMRLVHACMESTLIVNERQKTLGIIENVLIALTKLTSNYDNLNYYTFSACLQIMTSCVGSTMPAVTAIDAKVDAMMNKLSGELVAPIIFLNVIAVDYFNVGSRAIVILNRIIENIRNITSKFEYVCDSYKRIDYSTHLVNILFSAVEELWKHKQAMTNDNKKLSQLESLVKRVVLLLTNLVTNSASFKQQIGKICGSNQNPVMLLPYLDTYFQIELIKFIVALTLNHDQLNGMWSINEHVVKILKEQTMQSTSPEMVHYSNVVLERLSTL